MHKKFSFVYVYDKVIVTNEKNAFDGLTWLVCLYRIMGLVGKDLEDH